MLCLGSQQELSEYYISVEFLDSVVFLDVYRDSSSALRARAVEALVSCNDGCMSPGLLNENDIFRPGVEPGDLGGSSHASSGDSGL